MPSPFDYLKAIDAGHPLEDISGYSPFLINKQLSVWPGTILYANEMNINYALDPKLQHAYYVASIRPTKRRPYVKWMNDSKKNKDLDVGAVAEYYKINTTKARQALNILTSTQLETIKKTLIKGG